MKVELGRCRIVGGMRPARGGAAFARGKVVLRCDEHVGTRLIVRKFLNATEALGDPLREEDWQGLLASQEAMELDASIPAAPQTSLWLFRPNFSFREVAIRELVGRRAWLHQEIHEDSFTVIVDESKIGALREEWGARAFNAAWAALKRGRADEAVEDAELAFDLSRGLVDESLALVSLVYDRAGDKARGEAYLEMARNSEGEEFYRRVCEKKERFARECRVEDPGIRPRDIAKERRAKQKRAIDASFEVFPGASVQEAA